MKVDLDPRVDKKIRSLPKKDIARIVRVTELFEKSGFNLTEQYLKKLQTNLWELRPGRWRLLFGFIDQQAVVVNIFLKKTKKTPLKEISLATKRLTKYI